MIGNKPTILLVDDEQFLAKGISVIIGKKFDCNEMVIAMDGEQAWQLLQEKDIDLVISDWNMPKKNGAELLRDMKSNPKTSGIPFLMLTGRADVDSIKLAQDAGVVEYIVKPFNGDELVKMIKRLLNL